jgi:alkylation response protein AidB-like acyl-CoA dehydrogenase
MDFTVPVDSLAEHRETARRWVAENLPELPEWAEEQRVSGNYHTPELHRRLAEAGWYAAGWPVEYGGRDDVDPGLAQAVIQAVMRSGVHNDGWATTEIVINTLRHVGTEDQKREFIGGALRGEVIIVLGYTEPDSGSDVAAAKTRAVRDGDHWVVNGQKMFTSTAHMATHAFMLTRTNTDAPKHRGLTTFMLSLSSPGVEVQPVWTLGGQRTNATYAFRTLGASATSTAVGASCTSRSSTSGAAGASAAATAGRRWRSGWPSGRAAPCATTARTYGTTRRCASA